MTEINEACVICFDTQAVRCSTLDCCTHPMCMECAMAIATSKGGAKCPICRRGFKTVTPYDGRCSVDIQERTLYRRVGNSDALVAYLVMSDTQMKIASRIKFGAGPDGNGGTSLQFYVPQILREMTSLNGWSMVVSNADDGPLGMVMTRSLARAYWYDKDKCRQEIEDAEKELLNMFSTRDVPNFFLKAVVSKAFTQMVIHGKYSMKMYPPHLENMIDGGEHILSIHYSDYIAHVDQLINWGVLV